MEAAKIIINDEISKKLDIQQLSLAASEPYRIADFGCSSGPNTILAIQSIVEAVERKFATTHGPSPAIPEFQVFFNDQISNDFNSLFASLPLGRKYYAAGVAGSFHDRQFPTASLHFVYSSCALNWLSKLPNGVAAGKAGPAWNPGRIYYLGAPKEVIKAYSDQFAKELDSFLRARMEELVAGGLMALVIPADPDVITYPDVTTSSELELLGSCLMDMAKMGIISETTIDTFNVPIHFTSPKELRQIIERNGCFRIERMDVLNFPKQHEVMPDLRMRTLYGRASVEGFIKKHFGSEILDQLFEIYSRKLSESSIFLNPDYQKTTALFVLLKPM